MFYWNKYQDYDFFSLKQNLVILEKPVTEDQNVKK